MSLSKGSIKLIGTLVAALGLSGCYESDIAAGGAHTIAYKDGTLYTWGRNTSNQAGNGETSRTVDLPTAIDLPLPRRVGVIDIKANLNFTLLLDSAGDVWVWGTNREGQIGNGTNDKVMKPTKVEALDRVFITDIGAGQRHALAVSKRGHVWAWGNNAAGQLGFETDANTPATNNVLTPTRVPELQDIVDVEGGGSFSLAVTRRGKLLSWGSNDNGQLGVDPDVLEFRHAPEVVSGINKRVKSAAAGKDHAAALFYDGSVMAWGQNFSGQLGIGSDEDTHTPTPVKTDGVKMRSISASGNFTLAVSKQRDLYSWGQDLLGSLGTGPSDTNVPTKVEFFTQPVKKAVNGLGHTIVITQEDDGSEAFWTFGLNSFGQIGVEDAPFANYDPLRVVFDSK
ncbi:RCC1 domain-containing protein [Vibrio nigripulchritudo]|uniref:RCC1 domain-containing protein n=1 Tax=Vibrio nigripulchritudo TaxID=28173 RepID=UPI002493573A|nr:RCC1 domain-containing protein [Vibrio nigripulchritudo]BDU39715.1 hypothetical protein TUMSATVNIG2_41840 [Vibrio nigripulchritudo]BDU45438.1 hypothetical protein TUMSATVNIG3_42360 [Vibrio nigripulchritudo]